MRSLTLKKVNWSYDSSIGTLKFRILLLFAISHWRLETKVGKKKDRWGQGNAIFLFQKVVGHEVLTIKSRILNLIQKKTAIAQET